MVVKWPTVQPANQPSGQSAKYTKISQVRSKIQPTSTKLGPQIHQVGYQNPPKSVLEGLLERSWAHLGPKRAPRAKMLQNPNVRTPYIGAKLEVKIDKKSIGALSKLIFFLFLLIASWIDLVPTWHQLGTQNPPKMESSWLPRAMKRATSQNAKITKKNCRFFV